MKSITPKAGHHGVDNSGFILLCARLLIWARRNA
jgi:hypothetical protein